MATKRKSTRSRGKSSSKRRKSRKSTTTAALWALYAACLLAGTIAGSMIYRHYAGKGEFPLFGSRTAVVCPVDLSDLGGENERG